MKLLIIGIKDTAVEYFQPAAHVVRARGEALRNFTDVVNDPQSKHLHNHPQDFELWILGELDDQTGEISGNPERLARGIDVKQG